jgi:hypothetical protein
VRVGQRRDYGRRDRFVDLPISFIPTKKSAPSAHHFKFEHNNESVYVPQSDLCSYNSIVFANDDGTDVGYFKFWLLIALFLDDYVYQQRLFAIGSSIFGRIYSIFA